MGQISPMMQDYLDTKEQYKDCIVFYRLGDFYEMFFDDALTASGELELTLTGKNCGLEERAPMCGVPFHSAETYINRLIEKGYKVAICEQVEDPATAKGLVRREVTRIVTPGTNSFTSTLDETKNNYLMAIVAGGEGFGVSVVDVTTGEFHTSQSSEISKLLDEINRYMPAEIVANDALFLTDLDLDDLRDRLGIVISALAPSYFDADLCERTIRDHFSKTSDELGLSALPLGKISAGAVMIYLLETQKNPLSHISHINIDIKNSFMLLDRNTRRNLELVETMREKEKRGSLLWVLDKTKTAMGARMLRSNIERPLLDKDMITARYDAIEELNSDPVTREELREYLSPVYDLERLISKISYQTINPRDMLSLGNSLEILPAIKRLCGDYNSALLSELADELDPLEDICKKISSEVSDEPALSLRDGGIIKEGFNPEVDRLREAKTKGKEWIADLKNKEIERTGIKKLKIDYNKVFGYYLEVTNSFLSMVPDDWMRKQTLTNSERYSTPELKELEETILGAQDKLYSLEYALFCDLRDEVASHMERILHSAAVIAKIDMLASLAYVAEREGYCRPILRSDGVMKIRSGRHPVIEKMIPNNLFIPNDTYLDKNNDRIAIITGPNMAGKSTYMRTCALIQLMAQIGSYVPATEAELSIADRIFTRVGASDDLASGQSTFMVEMNEVAYILKNATSDSLIILDEIGRGTSTFDGLSIAWAVVEHIADKKLIGAKTLFATHYHELTELGGTLDGVVNYCIAVKDDGEDIVFLRKIVPGGADRSYGIEVAKLAGVPEDVLTRAKAIAAALEADSNGVPSTVTKATADIFNEEAGGMKQLSIFDALGDMSEADENSLMDNILCEIRDTDLSNITPIEAINLVNKWQKEISDKW